MGATSIGGTSGSRFTAPEQIDRDMQAAGYERAAGFDFLERQSFQISAPAGEAPAP